MTPAPEGLAVFTDSCQAGTHAVGSSPLRRLSRDEYNNMVRDLGLDPMGTKPASKFVSEQKIPGNFNTNSYAGISGTLFNSDYLSAAETLASNAVTTNNLNNLTASCATKDATCAQKFIASFAGQAFRGQLDDTASAALLQLYNTVSAQFSDFGSGIQAIIEAVLTSPRFLFVLEFGQAGSGPAVALTPMELATRLALYLWRSLPDQTLISAATGGHLATASDVATQAARMLADPKAVSAMQDFTDQWLDIENMDAVTKDTSLTKWTAGVAQDLHTETQTDFSSSVLTQNTDFTTLLTSPSSYINGDLATFYGVTGGSPSFSAPTMVNTAANPRAGILSNGSVLAIHSHTTYQSPTLRGRMVRQQILCQQVPDPPAAVVMSGMTNPPTALTTGDTVRSEYMQHFMVGQTCTDCHQLMDWIGFGFEAYDATGAHQTMDNGGTLDASGMILADDAAAEVVSTFTDMPSLVSALAGNPQTDQCFALQELRYALQRVEAPADACSAQQILSAFTTNKLNIQQLLVAVVSSDAFMYRTPVTAGAACQ